MFKVFQSRKNLRLPFILKPREMANMKLLAIWIDQRQRFKILVAISHIHVQDEILKQKYFTGSKIEGTPKLLKAFFARLFLQQNYETLEVFNSDSVTSTHLQFGLFIAK